MKDEVPTYDEYLKANLFAQFKYKYGLFVLIGCWVCLIILIAFVYIYSTELSSHPAHYMMKSISATSCTCQTENNIIWYVNETGLRWRDTTDHGSQNYSDVDLSDYFSNSS